VIETICGVDVSKAWLDGWTVAGGHRRFANDPSGIAELGEWAVSHGAGLVVMEATGGIEQEAFATLWQRGLPGALANPRQVRKFAEALGKLEKTDRIDAEVIARFAEARRIVATPVKSEKQQSLDALSARLRQVTQDLIVQKMRLHSTRDRVALESLQEAIAFFTKQSKELARQIAELIQHDPVWVALDQTFRQVKGVADRTVAVLLAELPEIGTLSNKAIAKLAGLAPIANDSGKRTGQRPTRGGRATVRNILFLVADIARKYDQSLNEFRDRLIKQGKPKMVVRIALARKLLVRLNAKARETRQNLAANA
jgi:transposase